MAERETRVRVSIEADKTTGAVQAAGAEIKQFGQDAKAAGEDAKKAAEGNKVLDDATASLNSTLTSLVGGAAIAAFFKAAVEASLEEAEALRVVKFQVEATGNSWEKYKSQIDAFATSQQALTQFDDTVTIQVLGKMTRATGDVEAGMRATALAQDIASATGKDLAETTQLVSGLLTGQSRAVTMAQKDFKAYVGEADTTQEVLDKLTGKFEGAAVAQDGHSKSIKQSTNALGEFAQRVGDGVVPVYDFLLKGVTMVTKGYEMLGATLAGVLAAVLVLFDGVAQAYVAVLTLQFGKASEIARETKDSLVTIAEESGADISAIEARYDEEKTVRVVNHAALVATKSQEEAASVKDAEAKKVAERKKAEELTKKLEEERKKNFASTLGFISTLSTAKNKELAIVGKVAGIANAYINTGVAVTRALASAPPPFNFVLAAAVGAAGAAQIATIAGVQLEKGGVTNVAAGNRGGTFANIGENNKREAVLPLDDARAMGYVGVAVADALARQGGGTGGGTNIFLTVNATLDWRDIMNKLAEEAANGSPEIVRVARRLGDLNELHSGRAS